MLVATDTRGLSSPVERQLKDETTNTVVITVRPGVNDAPEADAGADQVVDEGDVVTLAGTGRDPENEDLVYGWRQVSGSMVSLYDAAARSTTFQAPVQLVSSETLSFVLVVSDTRGLSSPMEAQYAGLTTNLVVVTVRPGVNDAPEADAGADQIVDEGDKVTLNGDGSDDPEREELRYAWRQVSGGRVTLTGATIGATTTATFTAPVQLAATATLVFELTVTDARGATDVDVVVVEVAPGVNDAPTANAGADQVVDEDDDVVTLAGTGSDPEKRGSGVWLAPGQRHYGVVVRRRGAQHDVPGAGAVGEQRDPVVRAGGDGHARAVVADGGAVCRPDDEHGGDHGTRG